MTVITTFSAVCGFMGRCCELVDVTVVVKTQGQVGVSQHRGWMYCMFNSTIPLVLVKLMKLPYFRSCDR